MTVFSYSGRVESRVGRTPYHNGGGSRKAPVCESIRPSGFPKKERGLSAIGQDKAKLHEAAEIGIEVDPDGLSENRGDVMARKH